MGCLNGSTQLTGERAIEHFTRYLTHPMSDPEWAADLARRLVAYDPLACEYAGIQFEADNRIVVHYRCDTRSRAKHTFVIPQWTPPTP